jgi:hypothetical protein
MAAFLYRCPATGLMVQAWSTHDGQRESAGTAYELVTCTACRRAHLVHPPTGKIVGTDDKRDLT